VVGHFDRTINISKETATAMMSRRPTGWLTTGIIFTAIGSVSTVAGIYLIQAGGETGVSWGWINLGFGLLSGGAGVTAIVLSLRVHDEIRLERSNQTAANGRGLRLAGVAPFALAGGGGIGITGRY
jgi:hypothetical protein